MDSTEDGEGKPEGDVDESAGETEDFADEEGVVGEGDDSD